MVARGQGGARDPAQGAEFELRPGRRISASGMEKAVRDVPRTASPSHWIGAAGFEPATLTSQTSDSTAELHPELSPQAYPLRPTRQMVEGQLHAQDRRLLRHGRDAPRR